MCVYYLVRPDGPDKDGLLVIRGTGVRVRTTVQQHLHILGFVFLHGDIQCRPPKPVGGLDVGTGTQQPLENVLVVVIHGLCDDSVAT